MAATITTVNYRAILSVLVECETEQEIKCACSDKMGDKGKQHLSIRKAFAELVPYLSYGFPGF